MRKLSNLVAILLLLVASFAPLVQAQATTVDIQTITTPTVAQGQTATFTMTVASTSGTLAQVNFASTALTGPSTINAPTINSITNLQSGTPQQVTFTVSVPTGATTGTYTGTVTATEQGNTANTDQMGYTLTVTSAQTISVSFDPSPVNFFVAPSDEDDIQVVIRNTGSTALTNLVVSQTLGTLEDSNENEVTFTITPNSIANLAPGASQTLTLNADVDSDFESETFTGELVVTATQGRASTPLTFGVQPVACLYGEQGDLDVEIETPDDDEEIDAGELFDVQVRVENTGNSDIDVTVEAVLYNQDKDEIVSRDETGERNIDEDDDYMFDLQLELDTNVDEDDKYTIFVKAYEDGNQDEHCNDGEDIDIEAREVEDKVIIESFNLSPISATCQEEVSGSLTVVNEGSNDADVKVTISNPELGLNDVSPTFTLDSNGRNDAEKIVSFAFNIPRNADEKTYRINAVVDYNGFTTTQERTVTVEDCRPASTGTGTGNVPPPTGTTTPPSTDNGDVIYTERSFFDNLGQVPTTFWVFANIILVLGIIFLGVGLYKRSKNY